VTDQAAEWIAAQAGPKAASVFAARYHPYVASTTTRGFSLARPGSASSAAGLFVIRAVHSFLPSSVDEACGRAWVDV
jgi:hypothetical protein